ncbi:MAG: DUF3096 domain-containing protein [Chloroflexi bacterium]|nr:DUF3096 domain-containing protein [Chloroflexota bacterium]
MILDGILALILGVIVLAFAQIVAYAIGAYYIIVGVISLSAAYR